MNTQYKLVRGGSTDTDENSQNNQDLQIFIDAQKNWKPIQDQIKNGKKVEHWIWCVYPQYANSTISESSNTRIYNIRSVDFANEYLNDKTLRERLIFATNYAIFYMKKDGSNIRTFLHNNPNADIPKFGACMTIFKLGADKYNRDEAQLFNQALCYFRDDESRKQFGEIDKYMKEYSDRKEEEVKCSIVCKQLSQQAITDDGLERIEFDSEWKTIVYNGVEMMKSNYTNLDDITHTHVIDIENQKINLHKHKWTLVYEGVGGMPYNYSMSISELKSKLAETEKVEPKNIVLSGFNRCKIPQNENDSINNIYAYLYYRLRSSDEPNNEYDYFLFE